ncbi:MAG: mucoidy inhibitor MuiA family protein, partial [Bacteroidota bacterium]
MRIFYSILFIISILGSAPAQTPPKKINSKIQKVVVFSNGAQIIREAQVSIPAGENQMVFEGISPFLQKESIRLEGEGRFTVLSVIHQPNFLVEQKKRKEIEELEDQQEAIRDQKTLLQSELEVFQQEEKMLLNNQEIGGENTGLNVADLQAAVDFQRKRLREVKLKQIELKKKIKAQDEALRKVNKQLIARNAEKDLSTSEVLVKLKANAPVSAKFTLSYYVPKAGWYASYDLRVKDIASPILLDYKANVYQSTGEDWKNVQLTLSNANPNQSGSKPELNPWYLNPNQRPISSLLDSRVGGLAVSNDRAQFGGRVRGFVKDAETGESIPYVNVILKGTNRGAATDANGFFSLDAPIGSTLRITSVGYMENEVIAQGNEMVINLEERYGDLQEVVVTGMASRSRSKVRGNSVEREKKAKPRKTEEIPVTVQQNQTSVSFDIEIPYTILSDGKTNNVDIQAQELKADYQYYAVPKLDPEAFLTARITGWEEYNLLPGEANLFLEGAYLGKSFLNPLEVEDTLQISLGRDKNVVIKREKQKDFSKKSFLGGNKQENRGWEINIRNTKKAAINMTIEDQIPVSTRKDIEVKTLDLGGAQYDENKGKLSWTFEL